MTAANNTINAITDTLRKPRRYPARTMGWIFSACDGII